ncbi:sugar phosphate isomerase/epimerase [Egibacter rhizosphaerae]|uniref:Sugar phosphate isomerase/epimerase n=1 Tax=Egibacter rhizosphaerae TaxID=1670831 RepID=A0A411YC40_9ACTN|nr:TIM barrel protein [Egibacter rhizosphaerae]QBI18756.1 sugar phosphate isomerase/epimerase [Egibacter rhizosphaerae]
MATIGFSSWAFPDDPAEAAIEVAHTEGFDALEFAFLTEGLWQGEHVPRPAHAARLGAACGDLRRSVHAPIEPMALASPDAAERRESGDLLARSIEAAAALAAEVVVVHLRHGREAPRPEWLRLALEPLAWCGELARDAGVVLGVENYGVGADHADGDYAALVAAIDELDHPAVAMTFDTGHAHVHLEGSGAVPRAAQHFGARVAHYHVHDNLGVEDDHLAIGDGSADLVGLVPGWADGFDGMVILEIFPFRVNDVRPGLRRSRDTLRAWLRGSAT